MRLFHLIAASEWSAVHSAGADYAPPSLAAEGFVHFSFADQVAGTANRYYRAVPDLIVLEVDPDRLASPVQVEDSRGSGIAFPHVYSAIPLGSVVAVHPISRSSDGDYLFSPDA